MKVLSRFPKRYNLLIGN